MAEAVSKGDLHVVEWLLQHGANASDYAEHGEPPICAAAADGHWSIVWRPHEAGADLKAENEHGGTLLMSAVHGGEAGEVRRLLSYGLDANHANRRGDTPLTLAAGRGDLEMIQLLMASGAATKPRGTRAGSWSRHRSSAVSFRCCFT